MESQPALMLLKQLLKVCKNTWCHNFNLLWEMPVWPILVRNEKWWNWYKKSLVIQFSGIKQLEGKYKPGSSGETGTPGLKHWNVEYGPSTNIPDSSIKDIVCKLHIIRQKDHKMGQVSYFDHIRELCSILLNQHKVKLFILILINLFIWR